MRQVPVTGGVLLAIALSVVAVGQTASQPKGTVATKQIQMSGGIARLDKPVDTGKVRAGDVVTAKLVESIRLADGTTLPKDAILGGHVVEVEPSLNGGDSTLVLLFDQVTVKGKPSLAVKVTIQRVIAPPVPGPKKIDPTESELVTRGYSQGGGANVDSGMPSVGNLVPPAHDKDPSVPGVTLDASVRDANSGTLTSKGKNTQLPLWTQFQIAVVRLPPNAVIN
jgi:hypothetical protein